MPLAARTVVGPAAASRLRALAAAETDWPRIVATAEHHGVVPLLYRSLRETAADLVPAETLARLGVGCATIAHDNLQRTGGLLRVLALLERRRIPALPFKGPVLAVQVYGELGARPFGDLDILVPARSVEPARDALLSAGFRVTKHLAEWQMCLVDRAGTLAVDLHWNLTGPDFPSVVDVDRLLQRQEPVFLGGRLVPAPSREDLLVALCIQLAKDARGGKNRLLKVCDVAELVRSFSPVTWRLALDRARAAGAERMLLFALVLARELAEVELPAAVTDRLRRHRALAALGSRVARGFVATERPGTEARRVDDELHRGLCSRHLLLRRRVRGILRRLRVALSRNHEPATAA